MMHRDGWRGLLAALVILALAQAAPALAQGAPAGPHDVIRTTADELLALIEEARDYVKDDPERFFVAVEALLRPVVDFESFARSVMAVHYRSASAAQRERFAETFKWGLVRSYALALTEFQDGEVKVLPPERPPRSPERQSVKMEIHTSTGDVYPVVYSMALGKDGQWRMRNIIINGVNIGLTYRSQFASAVQDPKHGGDLDRVIDAWADVLRAEAPDTASAEVDAT